MKLEADATHMFKHQLPLAGNLLFSELTSDPLKSLELSMRHLFVPVFDARENWGKATSEHKQEFLQTSKPARP